MDRAAAYGSLLKPSREATDDEACLNVNQYAAVLATLFESASSTERFCFGLFGHWGRGKTYLMQRVARVLQQRGYATVNFSAWKFRTTPEVWAHLYESVYSAACSANRLFPIRLNVTRHGFWPAVVALATVNVAMLPLGDRVQLLTWLLNALGVAVCIYVLMLYARLRPVFVRLRDMYMTVPRHGDKLGLQFAIGEDFKSLLKAWVPRPGIARPAPTTLKTWFQYLFAKSPWWTWWQFGGFVALVVVACLLGVQVYLAGTARAGSQTWGQVVMQVATFGLPAFIIGLPLIAIEWPTAQAKRALLIVDDLDRCPADQMLDIVECLQLFLDDDAVASRLQVCMMIEDEILQAALHKKYGRYFAKHGSDGGAPQAPALQERLRRRVIEENLEKLFLIHLRLAPVGTPELQEIMQRYCRPRVSAPKKPASQTERNEPTGGLGVPPAPEVEGLAELGRLLNPDDQGQVRAGAEDLPPIVDSELTADEAKLLEEAVPQFEPSSYAGRWGPRSVRKFVLRYQLARMLLKELRQPVNPRDLIHELLRPPEDNARRVDDAHPLLWAVVRQVT